MCKLSNKCSNKLNTFYTEYLKRKVDRILADPEMNHSKDVHSEIVPAIDWPSQPSVYIIRRDSRNLKKPCQAR